MPATEQMYRDPNHLHQWFGWTGLVLLIVTIWMFAADHNREWKPYQANAREIELKLNLWRQLQAKVEANRERHEQLVREIQRAKAGKLPEGVIKSFKSEIARYADSNGVKINEETEFASINQSVKDLEEATKKVEEVRAAAEKAQTELAAAESELSKAIKEKEEAEKAVQEKAWEKADPKPSEADAKKAADAAEKKLADAKAEEAKATKAVEEKKGLFDKAEEAVNAAEVAAVPKKGALVDKLTTYVTTARIAENRLLESKKFKAAEFDAAKGSLGLMVRDNRSQAVQDEQQKVVDQVKAQLNELTLKHQAANDHRKNLQAIIRRITEVEAEAAKELAALGEELSQLRKGYKEIRSTWFMEDFPYLGRKWLEIPILDAFNSPNKIENQWLPKLTIDFNFKRVPRFDRCVTCHKLIDKAMADAPAEPAFSAAREIEFDMTVPEKRAEPSAQDIADELSPDLMANYGFSLAPLGDGLVSPEDVAIDYVRNGSLAAKARQAGGQTEAVGGLLVGDVIRRVNQDKVVTPKAAEQALLETVRFGKTSSVRITVRRGVPNPYSSHPRLDLYVGPTSPHPMQTMGCTICHEGQGTATAFKFASHSPDNLIDESRWKREHGWFDNHHWIFPMYEKRFAEATCLKCHHQVSELEASPRFPEAPAPKVTEGFHLIRRFGCYGCHEINGFDGPARRIGPDLRLEPNFFATAQQMNYYLAEPRAKLAAERKPKVEALAGLMVKVKEVYRDLAEIQAKKLPATPSPGTKPEEAPKPGEEPKPSEQPPATATAQPAAGAPNEALLNEQKTKLDMEILAAREALSPTDARMAALDEAASLAERLAQHPDDDSLRARLRKLVEDDAPNPGATTGGFLPPEVRQLADQLRDVESPGALRKAGPSLRYVKSKLDHAFMADWIRDPQSFRPSTLMPRFFGHWEHLGGAGLKTAEDFEPIEILGMAAWLQANSQAFEPETKPEGIKESAEDEKIARGKATFETRGCIACHNHADFPAAAAARGTDIPQGPDLTGLGSKFDKQRNPKGYEWLYGWIKNPTKYHPRTRMPNLFLDPVTQPDGSKTDPVDDIREYLVSSKSEWHPPTENDTAANAAAIARGLDEKAKADLDRLALENLKPAYIERQARAILQTFDPKDSSAKAFDTTGGKGGIPESSRATLKGALVELVGDISTDKKLLFVGRSAIGKYGCYGCHDIPGFEDAKPIGTSLADWGRKNPATLAFLHIGEYLHGGHSHAASGSAEHKEGEHKTEAAMTHARGPSHTKLDDFYEHKLMSGSRIGFIAQKLLEPRSYDYKDVENKPYNDRLRMPQFPLDAREREAVITFVLGLVSEPPVSEYVYQPNPRQKAILEGKQVLAKYNCGGCHMLEMDKWDISYAPGELEANTPPALFPYLARTRPEPDPKAQVNRQGRIQATLHGLPALTPKVGTPKITDPDGEPLSAEDVEKVLAGDKNTIATLNPKFALNLWQPQWIYTPHAASGANGNGNGNGKQLDSQLADAGNQEFALPMALVQQYRPAHSGFLARYLPQVIIAHEVKGIKVPGTMKEIKKPTVGFDEGTQVWAYGPPPLVYEGKKVQAEWLHNFLLEPYPIRPAVVLRMPKFNMSRKEATQLVDYFAAIDDAEYPYRTHPESPHERSTTPVALPAVAAPQPVPAGASAARPSEQQIRRDQALRLVGKACAGCHKLGEGETGWTPAGSDFAKAPNLARVYERLRPEYVRPWVGYPSRILTYTKMLPVFPYEPEKPLWGAQNLDVLPGNSLEQLDAVVDLLMHFDEYSKEHSGAVEIVRELQKSAPPPK